MNENIESLTQINFISEVLGVNDHCFMRFTKRVRNPDVFTYDHSIEYKEDFSLITDSYCDCGCKTAIYVKEEWNGDGYDTEFKTQTDYENLPNTPQPTSEQVKLSTDTIRANRKEEELGIIHGHQSCGEIPIPKLVFNKEYQTTNKEEGLRGKKDD